MDVSVKSFPYDCNHKAGSWKGLALPLGTGYVRSASFTCPSCGRVCSLSDHQIAEDGTVAPSVVCPYMDCDFHEFIRLEGWDPKVNI